MTLLKAVDRALQPDGRAQHGLMAYFESRAMNDWYDFVVSKILREEEAGRLTRATLARRLNMSPSRLSRLLSGPGNWTIATVSNLLLGIGEEPVPQSKPIIGADISSEGSAK